MAHHKCEFEHETDHGYRTVEVDFRLRLCEVGENCHEQCAYSYKPGQTVECPTCHGNMDVMAGCPQCWLFGIVRVEDIGNAVGVLDYSEVT